jgi:hypothetical protein
MLASLTMLQDDDNKLLQTCRQMEQAVPVHLVKNMRRRDLFLCNLIMIVDLQKRCT